MLSAQKVDFSLVVLFTCGNFTLIFTVFRLFGSDFLNGSPNSFIIQTRPSFLFKPNVHFSLVVFVHIPHFDIDFFFFF